jgi:hypothetical protein
MAALLITAVMMLGAVAIDYGRMQYFRAQLRTAADAAAHSGAVVMSRTASTDGVPDSARSMGLRELVNGQSPIVDLVDIKLGDWDDINHTLDTIAPIDGYDAVKVTARYNGTFLLANRLFGTTGGQLKVTAIAWTEGSVVDTRCLKPWAFPYAALLGTIGQDPANDAYNLTPDDIAEIATNTADNPIKISLGGSDAGNIYWEGGDYAGQNVHQYTPGNFGHLDLDPSPGSRYEDEIAGCAENNVSVGGGLNVLDASTGGAVGQTIHGVETLCQEHGSYVADPPDAGHNADFDCAVPLKVAIYANASGTGTGTSYVTKYIGGVILSGYRHNGWLYAYFTGFQTSGSVSSAPGPVERVILVH